MRPIWTGSIGFGLVSIPVKLFSATQRSELDLDMLDKRDHSNIKYMRVSETTGREVDWDNIVKGFLLNNKYVVLTDRDFESASAEKTKIITITDFVKDKEIDSIYYETPYYLEPDKSGTHAYALLREALEQTGKVGIATFVMRNKEALAILRADEEVIILNRMRFYEEVRPTEDLTLPPASSVKPGELKMAVSLINQLTGTFDPSKYKDTYTAQLMKLIRAKSKGVKIREPHMKIVHSSASDLMSQLKASLGGTKTKRRRAS